MRVIEPKAKNDKRMKPARVFLLVFIAILLSFGILYGLKFAAKHFDGSKDRPNDTVEQQNNTIQEFTPKVHTTLKKFTPEEFKTLYQTFIFPNTQKISEDTPITGNPDVDKRIVALAHERGYTIRSAPVVDNFITVSEGNKLQQKAYQDYKDMEAAALLSGNPIELTAAYRSAEDQKTIFLSRLGSATPSDQQIIKTLAMTAPPGYSRHHTGYTVDIACSKAKYQQFHTTPCFAWISQNNYENAKKYGWIPSYPEGTKMQGPEPEAWEYVWVGKDATYQ